MKNLGNPENRRAPRMERYEVPACRAEEEQGLGSLKLMEVIRMRPIRPVPRAPKFIKGVIDFRGRTIPVVDLRIRLGMKPKDYTADTLIAVVEAVTASGTIRMGIVPDSISGLTRTRVSNCRERVATERIVPKLGRWGKRISRSFKSM